MLGIVVIPGADKIVPTTEEGLGAYTDLVGSKYVIRTSPALKEGDS